MDDIPWKMIFIVGGATIAVIILGALTAYATGHLAIIPN